MIITGTLALFPIFSPKEVALNEYADFFAKTSSVYTGIIGVIVGYYFGRSEQGKGGALPKPADSPTSSAVPGRGPEQSS